MKKSKNIMGMPVVIEIADNNATDEAINEVFSYFHYIDEKFSTYKTGSEMSNINRGKLSSLNYSNEMNKILKLCEQTKKETNGYFNIERNGALDPSGLVKGYAIWEGAKILQKKGYKNFYVEIAGDIQIIGKNKKGEKWKVGIKNPFNQEEIIKVVYLKDKGIATSGNYIRGEHIYNPKYEKFKEEIVSLTVIGPNVYDADRFATGAFAMGERGIDFIASLKGFEGYMIKKDKTAIFTNGFNKFLN